MAVVFDIETDGLLDELTKIHVLSWMGKDGNVRQLSSTLNVTRKQKTYRNVTQRI